MPIVKVSVPDPGPAESVIAIDKTSKGVHRKFRIGGVLTSDPRCSLYGAGDWEETDAPDGSFEIDLEENGFHLCRWCFPADEA